MNLKRDPMQICQKVKKQKNTFRRPCSWYLDHFCLNFQKRMTVTIYSSRVEAKSCICHSELLFIIQNSSSMLLQCKKSKYVPYKFLLVICVVRLFEFQLNGLPLSKHCSKLLLDGIPAICRKCCK